MDLHTDGTYVKEITDWLMMTKIEEKNVEGAQTYLKTEGITLNSGALGQLGPACLGETLKAVWATLPILPHN